MEEQTLFAIQSSESDTQLLFLSHKGEYLAVELRSGALQASIDVWVYTDAKDIAMFFESLAQETRPWEGERCWESIEGEFRLAASCGSTGSISFEVQLRNLGLTEEWEVRKCIASEFGQLPALARKARAFFATPLG